jgi:hypothetical protein
MYEQSGRVPLDPGDVQAIQQRVLQVINDRNLTPNHPDARFIRGVADSFGREVNVPVADTVTRLRAEQRTYQRNSPEWLRINREISGRVQGNIAPERVFQTDINNFAQLQSAYRNLPYDATATRIDADEGLRRAVRGAIAEVADPLNPLFPEARQRFAEVRSLERIGENTSARNRTPSLEAQSGARSEVVPAIMYAGATTPAWALLPLVRELGARSMVRKYDQAFSQPDVTGLERLMREAPLRRSAQYGASGLLAPFRQGEFRLYEEDEK